MNMHQEQIPHCSSLEYSYCSQLGYALAMALEWYNGAITKLGEAPFISVHQLETLRHRISLS